MKLFLLLAVTPFVSVVPALIYLAFIWWMDRYDREPFWMVAVAFVWGALGATFLSLVISLIFQIPLASILKDPKATFAIGAVFIAPPVEEFFKGVILAALVFHKQFDNIMDGFVYGAAVGLGFAVTENFFYFVSSYMKGGVQAWAATVILRTAYTTLLHAMATGCTGGAFGWAKFHRSKAAKFLIIPAGLLLAMGIHGVGNFFVATTAITNQAGFFVINIMVFLVELAIILGVLQYALYQESLVIARELATEVENGTLTREQAELLPSYVRRAGRAWREFATFKFKQLGDWNRLAALGTELAFRKHQARLTDARQAAWYQAEIDKLREKIRALRSAADNNLA